MILNYKINKENFIATFCNDKEKALIYLKLYRNYIVIKNFFL